MLKRNQTAQFCIITPTAYLERYASQSSMHLVLAHLVDTDEQYADFYAGRSEFKIMDNGAFELGEAYKPSELVRLGQKCKANAIVLPDYPAQPWNKTVDAAIELIGPIKEAGFYTMFVPQSERGDMDGWCEAYQWAADGEMADDIDIIGMSILAIPNAMPHIPRAYARVVMTQLLIDRELFDFRTYHHYLGLNAGPKLEIPALITMRALDSCDSSNPVWTGICGQMYSEAFDSYAMTRKIDKHVDFNYPMTSSEYVHRAIQNNIDMTLDLMWRTKTSRQQKMTDSTVTFTDSTVTFDDEQHFCVDCKHAGGLLPGLLCRNIKFARPPNLVTGRRQMRLCDKCRRDETICGKESRGYEPR